ncbi:MAG TPA: hypothetical protein VGQ95_08345 [Chthoniobacterales bacterium]|nr:hypothetical protein [Chthoniobacterales bacterium]
MQNPNPDPDPNLNANPEPKKAKPKSFVPDTEDNLPPDPIIYIIFAGAFGGMLAPLLRVALALVQQEGANLDFKVPYWCGVLILGALGAGVAWGFRETKRQKAILLGLSLPAFLQLAVTDLQRGADHAKKSPPIASTGFSFPSSAYAASDSTPLGSPPKDDLAQPELLRTLAVRSLNSETDVSITFLDSSNNAKLTVALPAKKNLKVPIPDDASTVQFSVGDSASKPFPLPTSPRAVVAFDVKTNTRVGFGLGSAFGQRPTTTVDFEVTPSGQYLFYGNGNGGQWAERHFDRTDSSPTALPDVGVTVRARDAVNIRSDVIKYIPNQGWTNAPSVGVVNKGQMFRVLEVIRVPDNPTFIWIRFESL